MAVVGSLGVLCVDGSEIGEWIMDKRLEMLEKLEMEGKLGDHCEKVFGKENRYRTAALGLQILEQARCKDLREKEAGLNFEDRVKNHVNLVFSYSSNDDLAAAGKGFKFLGAGIDSKGGEVHVFERTSVEDFNKGG